MQLVQSYATEGLDWPEVINASLTAELEAQILEARKLLASMPHFSSITLKDTGLEIEEMDAIEAECRVGYSGVKVYSFGWYWELQSKYDSSMAAEYEPSEVANG